METVRRLCDYCENKGFHIEIGDRYSPEWLQLSHLEGEVSNGPDERWAVENLSSSERPPNPAEAEKYAKFIARKDRTHWRLLFYRLNHRCFI